MIKVTGIFAMEKSQGFAKLFLLRIVLLAASGLVALALGEIVLRLVRDSTRMLPYFRNSVVLSYPSEQFTPGVVGVSRFSTNRFGCRGPEFSGERLSMLTIGGSTTACTALDDTEAWPQLVMDSLNRRTGDPQAFWVTNSGIDGKNSRHHVMHARFLLPELPKLDFVLIYAGLNDAGSWLYQKKFDAHEMEKPERIADLIGQSFRISSYTPAGDPWYKHLETWKCASILKDAIKSRLNAHAATDAIIEDAQLQWIQTARERRAERLKLFIHVAKRETLPIALEFYANNLRTIANLVRENGAEPIFMSQATQWQGLSEEQKSGIWMGAMDGGTSYVKEDEMAGVIAAFNATMAEVAATNHVHFIDLEKQLRGHPEYYYDSCHFNELGARVAAEFIADDLLASGLAR